MVGGIILVSWIVLSVVVGFAGNGRKITFWGALGLSLIFSPIVGFLLVLCSSRIDYEQEKIVALQAAAERAIRKNDKDVLRYLYIKIIKIKPYESPNTCFKLAKLYADEGDREATLFYLNKAVNTGYPDFEKLRSEPLFQFIREDVKYREIINQMV